MWVRRRTKLGRAASPVHNAPQLAYGLFQPHKDRSTHHRMADVQLLDLRDCGDRLDVGNRETVTGVHREPELGTKLRGVLERTQGLWVLASVRVLPSV